MDGKFFEIISKRYHKVGFFWKYSSEFQEFFFGKSIDFPLILPVKYAMSFSRGVIIKKKKVDAPIRTNIDLYRKIKADRETEKKLYFRF